MYFVYVLELSNGHHYVDHTENPFNDFVSKGLTLSAKRVVRIVEADNISRRDALLSQFRNQYTLPFLNQRAILNIQPNIQENVVPALGNGYDIFRGYIPPKSVFDYPPLNQTVMNPIMSIKLPDYSVTSNVVDTYVNPFHSIPTAQVQNITKKKRTRKPKVKKVPKNPNYKWTAEKETNLISQYDQKKSITEMSQYCGKTNSAIVTRLMKLEKINGCVSDLCSVCGDNKHKSTECTLKDSLVAKRTKWAADELQKLQSKFDEGVTLSELAKLHGRSYNAIRLRLITLGKITA